MIQAYKAAFAELLAPLVDMDVDKVVSMVERPPANIEGDFGFPCFSLAKVMKKAPNMIAQGMMETLNKQGGHDFFAKILAVGPYVNVILDTSGLAEKVLLSVIQEAQNYGKGSKKSETWLVEGWSPNTHKALHVGHLRNALMSESVCTLLEAAGYKVIRTAYGGDVGAHVAKWLWYYLNFDKSNWPEQPEAFCKWAGLLYTTASKKAKEQEHYAKEIHELQLQLESGDQELVKLWKDTRKMSIAGLQDAFSELGCRIEKFYFESDVEQPGIQRVQDMEQNDAIPDVKMSQGAIIADLEPYDLGVFVLLKHNGTSLYSTKDIALAYMKEDDYTFDKSLYVVATEQNWHFKQLFKTLELDGYDCDKLHHLGYAMVEAADGKMSSRDGTVILYHDYRDETIKKVRALLDQRELSDLQKDEIARSVTFGALKFSMLLQDSYKKIVFDMERALSFDGETGPYVQYTHARAARILANADVVDYAMADYVLLQEKEEHALLLHMAGFSQAITKAAQEFRPNVIARYVLELSHAFNAFYQKHKVLVEDQKLMHTRLLLVAATRQILANGLVLLGIDAPEVM